MTGSPSTSAAAGSVRTSAGSTSSSASAWSTLPDVAARTNASARSRVVADSSSLLRTSAGQLRSPSSRAMASCAAASRSSADTAPIRATALGLTGPGCAEQRLRLAACTLEIDTADVHCDHLHARRSADAGRRSSPQQIDRASRGVPVALPADRMRPRAPPEHSAKTGASTTPRRRASPFSAPPRGASLEPVSENNGKGHDMRRNLAARAGHWSAAHWKTATFGWLALVAVTVVLGSLVGTRGLSDVEQSNGETARAEQMLADAGIKTPVGESVLVQSRAAHADRAALRRTAHAVHTTLAQAAGGRDAARAGRIEGRSLDARRVRPEGIGRRGRVTRRSGARGDGLAAAVASRLPRRGVRRGERRQGTRRGDESATSPTPRSSRCR